MADGESYLQPAQNKVNTDAVLTCDESDSLSWSSTTLSGDEASTSAVLSRKTSDSILGADDTDSSTGPELEVLTNSYIALRPLYSARRESAPEDGLPQAPGMKLAQRSRKGHRKSRQGCFNCKKRKIKCQETSPACENCIRKELQCSYPLVKAPSLLQACSEDSASPLVPVQLQATPIFSLVDMRLFHHFLVNAYPHLPVGNDTVWVRHIPPIAYHKEYLMHALLGLAASHITVCGEADYGSVAQSHRFLAIKGLNKALSKTPRSGSDGDALIAACYALTFQSCYMPDAMSEFLTMVRGCVLVALQLCKEKVNVSFSLKRDYHLEFMSSRLDNLPAIDADFLEGAVPSCNALAPLCKAEGHKAFQRALIECVKAASVDSRHGYYRFINTYHVLGMMDHMHFQPFLQADNDVTQLLLAHFVAVEIMFGPILGREWNGRTRSTPMESTMKWLLKMHDGISPPMCSYMNWPLSLATRIQAELRGDLLARPWLKDIFFSRGDQFHGKVL